MSETAIIVKGISKKYRLFDNNQDRLKEALHPFSKHYHREFWALDDVSFEIPKGQTVGILGRNGSGKSTLLQIIAGIMQPTSGEVIVNGRISALLELGAGFNPEFTGRENVIFQAQVMGFSSKEIDKKLPEIEKFADIGEFFDQPVKIYSSGMFVRVAFAAATSIDPDILIIDEALAVGDARFQESCYARMHEFKKSGKTILFVSHSVDAITALCDYAILLEKHRLYAAGEPKNIVDKYLQLMFVTQVNRLMPVIDHLISEAPIDSDIDHLFCAKSNKDECLLRRFYNDKEVIVANGGAAIIDYLIIISGEKNKTNIVGGDEISLYIKVRYDRTVYAPVVGFELKTLAGITIYGINTFLAKTHVATSLKGESRLYRFDFRLPLNHGDYFIDLGVGEIDGSPGGIVMEVRRSIIHFTIKNQKDYTFMGILDISASFLEIPLEKSNLNVLVHHGF
ncbi:ABC transporter ATP-binding protein [Methylobacter sp. S3L5C]|uniref:ABC transporter ATP-binding protein n=1 Tax=Methylobacter sp. S3L5C TaxID=2839024 RepID=UPI001FABF57D|nr:ABC transporter ATP-binding protein [Methylobacter sp. S3L5C]UOA07595.1 ABC transporter ATP-binding protein [Methylobacter sp. S3L5C]